MPSFLFWNCNNQSVAAALTQLVREHSADVVILAECGLTVAEVLLALNPASDAETAFSFSSSPDADDRIKIFTKFDGRFVTPFGDGSHFTVRRVKFPLTDELLLVAVHLPSRLAEDADDLNDYAKDVVQRVREREEVALHSRTIVVGDFNMNPFSRGMIGAGAFNAVSVKRIALKGSRLLKEQERKYFYNPMWTFFQEQEKRSPGTYFYGSPGYESVHWNIFDQVIIRPELIDRFESDSLKIIARCEGFDLTSGADRRPGLSDHLPIAFKLSN